MKRWRLLVRPCLLSAGLVLAYMSAGCRGVRPSIPAPGPRPLEGVQVTLDEYIANPPDILLVEMEATPSPKQVIKAGDQLQIAATNTLPDNPVNDVYTVQSDGSVDLGLYGRVVLAGKTVESAKDAVKELLAKELADPAVTMAITAVRPISGEYLIRPDGKLKLGFYGEVHVAGQTLPDIEKAIVKHLEVNEGLVEPKVSVDVVAYNSMVYYIVTDGAGFGDQVSRFPLTGGETVLDAMAEIGGLPQNGSKTNVWIARPIPGEPNASEILPIDWVSITKHGSTATNYQVLPGDRIFVKADAMITTNNVLNKVLAPFEQVLGSITLFNVTIRSLGTRQLGGLGGFGGT